MRKVLVAIGIALLLSLVGITINNAIAATSITDIHCKSASDTHKWGFWPGSQFVTDHTNWCYGKKWTSKTTYVPTVTSMSHTVSGHGDQVGGLCDLTGTKHWLLSDNGQTREWEDEGDFKCATNIPGVYVHRTDQMIIWANGFGKYCGPDNCPCAKDNSCSKY